MHWKVVGVWLFLLVDSGQCFKNSTDFGRRLNDSIFDGSSNIGNKAFLKTKLLENLNSFFPSVEANEQLEILGGPPRQQQQSDEFSNSVTESPNDFPTLIPHAPQSDPMQELEMATAPSTKIRTEGRINSLDTIRDWRMRLYKAFQNRSKISKIIKKSPTEEVVEMNDASPIIMDKNRQLILNRKEPNWHSLVDGKQIQTYGRDPDGKLIPLFGLDSNFLRTSEQQTPIQPYPPREIRLTYRTSNGQPVVYVPAAARSSQTNNQPDIVPVPVASYLVTANPPSQQQPIQLHILPPVTYSPPTQPPFQFIFPPAGPSFQATTPQTTYSTFAPRDYDDSPNECVGCSAQTDEKCNSVRLRNIIMNNISNGDAEASKKAIQSAAEAETGMFFDAICGTGFFSYIAHTDEFCLASSGGVNCYLFAPVCGGQESMKAKAKKTFLSRN